MRHIEENPSTMSINNIFSNPFETNVHIDYNMLSEGKTRLFIIRNQAMAFSHRNVRACFRNKNL
jgi:hypothetical protein